jgi:hypothetical protein
MLVGKTPFKGQNEYQTFENIKTGQYQIPSFLDPVSQDLVEKLL